LMPEAAGARAAGRLIWPPLIAVLGILPVLSGRDAFRHHHPAVGSTVTLLQLVIALDLGVAAWVRWQKEAHVWFAEQMELTKTAKPARTA
jgi:hypothetical protein